MNEPCSEYCNGVRCQVEGPHDLHSAVTAYGNSQNRKYARIEWPVDLPGKETPNNLKTWEKL